MTGTFGPQGAISPSCTNESLKFDQHTVPLTGFCAFVETTMGGRSGSCSFGLKWKGSPIGFPQYFKQDGSKMVAVPAPQVPTETGLVTQTFAPAVVGMPCTSPKGSGAVWINPGPRVGRSRSTNRRHRHCTRPGLHRPQVCVHRGAFYLPDSSGKGRRQHVGCRSRYPGIKKSLMLEPTAAIWPTTHGRWPSPSESFLASNLPRITSGPQVPGYRTQISTSLMPMIRLFNILQPRLRCA